MIVIVNFFTNIIDVCMMFFFLKASFAEEKTNKKNIIIGLIIVIVFGTIVNSILGLANFIGFILILLVTNIMFSLIFKKRFLIVSVMLIIGVVIMFILELITVNLITYIFQIPPSVILELNIYRILGIIIGKGSFILITRYWVNKRKIYSYAQNRKNSPMVFILLFNLIIMYVAFIVFKYVEINSYMDYIILSILTLCTIVFNWLIYIFTKKIIKQEQQEELMKLKIKEYENQNFYIKSMEDILLNIRAQRHEFNNYMSTLYGLILLDKKEEAEKYILNLSEDTSFINKIIDVGHPAITALINVKRDKILREKIKLDLEVQLPDDIALDYIDLSVVIGNLLDNAIEACLQPNINDPYIEFKMFTKENYLVITVYNSKSNISSIHSEALGERYTTKDDKENHGYGLNNIQRIVNEYKGALRIEDKDHSFNVNIELPIEKDIH